MTAKARPARPRTLFVLSETYTIAWLTEDDWQARNFNPDWGGSTHSEQNLIAIRLQPGKQEARYQEIVLHEILHTVWDASSLQYMDLHLIPKPDIEEHVIQRESPVLLFILKQNPDFAKWLLSDGNHVRS